MKFENIKVFNLYTSVKSSYNYRQNWSECDAKNIVFKEIENDVSSYDHALIFSGSKTEKHLKKLCRKGMRASHRKLLRQIFVSIDIIAPLNIWKHIDTYKIGTTAQSTSTMNSLGEFNFIQEMFENKNIATCTLKDLNEAVEEYSRAYKTNDEEKIASELFDYIDDNLPQSFLQMRTWTANYEVLRAIYEDRKNHKKIQWHYFCNMIEKLPYADILIQGL
jgi:hypothetical protein